MRIQAIYFILFFALATGCSKPVREEASLYDIDRAQNSEPLTESLSDNEPASYEAWNFNDGMIIRVNNFLTPVSNEEQDSFLFNGSYLILDTLCSKPVDVLKIR